MSGREKHVETGAETLHPSAGYHGEQGEILPPDPPNYRLIRLLGKGGMGRVYEAQDLRLDRRVAIKFLVEFGDEWSERFAREARALAHLDHPSLCQIYHIGEEHGRPYIVMPMIEGVSLAEAADQLSLKQKLHLIRDVALALHQAHLSGMIHRDLKPGNIMVSFPEQGPPRAHVLDFGLARLSSDVDLTMTGDILGTPGYMPPEQARGETERISHLVDVYGLGATFYFLLTHRAPFVGPSRNMILANLLEKEPVSPRLICNQLPRDVETMVIKCLEKVPESRYESTLALAEDITRFLDGLAILARSPGITYRMYRRLRRHKTVVSIVAIASLVLMANLAWSELRTQKRETMVRDVTSRVYEIENLARASHLSRSHDISADRHRLKTLMSQTRQQMTKGSPMSEGPGHFVLGWGFLVMGQYQEAMVHLERSQQAGFDTPHLDDGLMLAYSSLYRELRTSLAFLGGEMSFSQSQRLEKLRQKALSVIQKQTEPTHYYTALMAYCEGQYEDALIELNRAEVPAWFYERHKLRGDIYSAWATVKGRSEDQERAAQLYELAFHAYEQAIAIGSSDPQNYKDLARSMLVRLTQGQQQSADQSFHFSKCNQVLSQVSSILPADHETPLIQARLLYLQARRAKDQRIDPQPILIEALDAINQSLALGPASDENDRLEGSLMSLWAQWLDIRRELSVQMSLNAIEALERVDGQERNYVSNYALGTAYRRLAKGLSNEGMPTQEAYRCATTYFLRAIDQEPKRLAAYNGLAQSNYQLATILPVSQALPLLWESEQYLTKAIALNGKNYVLHYQMGRVLLRLAEGGKLGFDYLDTTHCERALEHFSQARELNPKQGLIYERISQAWLLKAQYAYNHGQPYEDSFTQAEAACEQGLSENSRATYLKRTLGMCSYFRAKYLLRSGQDPLPALQRAEVFILDAGKALENHLLLVNIQRLRAEWAFLQGQNPKPYFSAAETAFHDLAEVTHPQFGDSLVKLRVLKALWEKQQGLDWQTSLTAANSVFGEPASPTDPPQVLLAHVDLQLMNPNPDSNDYQALLTALELRQDLPELVAALACLLARNTQTPEGQALFQRALSANPYLSYHWSPRFREATALAQSF